MMSKRRPVPPLPQKEEWDFRQVPDEALADCVLWEYARESDVLRPAIEEWLATEIEGKTVREHYRDGRIREFWLGGVRHSRLTMGEVEMMDPDRFGDWRLFELLLLRDDFPAPWLANPITTKEPTGERVMVEQPDGRPLRYGYHLYVAWRGATVEEVVASFEKWAREEGQKHRRRMRKPGTPGHLPVDPLKGLVALRFKKAGFTYESAYAALVSYPEKRKKRRLPIYSDAPGWSKAVSNAKRHLRTLEAG